MLRLFDTMAAGILLVESNSKRDALNVMRDMSAEIEAYAQNNAPWADRTGMAREGLTTMVEDLGGEISLSLLHTVDYGQWLETIQNGTFAIIMPTLEHYADQVFQEAGARYVGRGL